MPEVRKLSDADKCEADKCESQATSMIYSLRLKKVVFSCVTHAGMILDEGSPEYHDRCNNCGCRQGVN